MFAEPQPCQNQFLIARFLFHFPLTLAKESTSAAGVALRGHGHGSLESACPRGFAATCEQDYPQKRFKVAQVNHKQNIFTKTYHFRGRLWGKSSRTIIAGTQQLDGTWKHLKKWRPQSMLHKKKQQVYQKRYSYAYSWTWRHNAALLQTVASALPQALWHR